MKNLFKLVAVVAAALAVAACQTYPWSSEQGTSSAQTQHTNYKGEAPTSAPSSCGGMQ